MIRLNPGRVVADDEFQVASSAQLHRRREWFRYQPLLRPKMELDRLRKTDGGGAKKLQARASKSDSIGFDRQRRKLAMQGISRNVYCVFDLIWRFGGRCGGEALRHAQSRARRDLGGRVDRGNDILLPDRQAFGVGEKGRSFWRLNSQSDADAIARATAG